MQEFLSRLGVLATVVLLAVSMAMNWRFGFGLGHTDIDGYIFGAASAAADVLKALLPLFGLWAFRQRRWLVVAVAVLVWIICTSYSMTSALGFAALNRSDVVAERRSKSENYLDKKDEIDRLRVKLNKLPNHRPLRVVEAVLAEYKQNRRWIATQRCSDVTVERSRSYCAGYFKLQGEVDVAKQEISLEKLIAERVEEIGKDALSVMGVGGADPQSAILSQIFNQSLEHVQLVLVVMLALLTEIGSGLGLFVTLGYAKDNSSGREGRFLSEVNDPRERFFEEAIEYRPKNKVQASRLYQHFIDWCKTRDIDPDMTMTAFGLWAVKYGMLRKIKVGGMVQYLDVGMR